MSSRPVHTCGSALRIFQQCFKAGTAPALRGDTPSRYSAARAAVITTHWMDTFAHIALLYGLDVPTEHVPVTPYLRYLDRWAYRASKQNSDSEPLAHNAASAVRLVCLTVCGKTPGRQRIWTQLDRSLVPPAFQPAYDVLMDAASSASTTREGTRRVRYFAHLLTLGALEGCTRLEDIPQTRTIWKQWAKKNDFSEYDIMRGLLAFEEAGTLLGNPPEWPNILFQRGGTRGLRQIPDLSAKLAAAGLSADPDTLPLERLIESLYPHIWFSAKTWLGYLEGRVRDSGTLNRVYMLSRLCFTLDALNVNRDVDPVDIATTMVDVTNAAATPSHLNKRAAHGPLTRVSLLRLVADHWAQPSAKHSALYVVGGSNKDVPFYTTTVIRDLEWLRDMTTIAQRDDMLGNPDPSMQTLWTQTTESHEALHKHIADYNRGLTIAGRMDPEKLLALVSYPQVVLMGGLALRNAALAARERWIAGGKPERGTLHVAYMSYLWDWMLLTMCFNDGLRIKNYAGALANKHITPVWEDGRIVSFATHFWGVVDEEMPRLKRDYAHGTRTRLNEREHDLPRSLVDPDLATDFWMVLRPHYLVASGALISVAAFDVTADYFAVFPSAASIDISTSPFCPIPEILTGRYSLPDDMSEDIGRIVHGIIRDVLRRPDIPEWDDPAITTTYRGLFGAHRPVRFLAGSFWGHEVGDWSHAQHLTNDSLQVVQDFYARRKGGSAPERARLQRGIDAVGHFTDIMQHIRNGGAVHWPSFDPEVPNRAILTGPLGAAMRRRPRNSE